MSNLTLTKDICKKRLRKDQNSHKNTNKTQTIISNFDFMKSQSLIIKFLNVCIAKLLKSLVDIKSEIDSRLYYIDIIMIIIHDNDCT